MSAEQVYLVVVGQRAQLWAMSGRTVSELDKPAAVLDAAPDMTWLTCGSMNFPTQASVNAPATIYGLTQRMREPGIMPELELFDLGMADCACYLVERGEVTLPGYANILLGSLGTASASAFNLATIDRVVAIARANGRDVATPAEARAVIGLPAPLWVRAAGQASRRGRVAGRTHVGVTSTVTPT